jgi:predicted secreted protein
MLLDARSLQYVELVSSVPAGRWRHDLFGASERLIVAVSPNLAVLDHGKQATLRSFCVTRRAA